MFSAAESAAESAGLPFPESESETAAGGIAFGLINHLNLAAAAAAAAAATFNTICYLSSKRSAASEDWK